MATNENNWLTIGHSNAKRMFDAQLSGDSLSHAYLLMGPSGIGKAKLAHELAEKIIGGASHNVSSHDVASSGSLDEIRELLHFASLTPISGSKKVVIIKNVDLISDASASALLKTLEEPPSHTYFILTSGKVQILPTIMSRCQNFVLSRLSENEMREFASTNKLTVDESMLSVAAGNPGKLLKLASGDERFKEIMTHISEIEPAIKDGDFRRMNLVNSFSELEDDMLEEVISGWLSSQVGILKQKPQRFTVVKTALETMDRLQHNFNKKMVLEYFVNNTSL